MKNILVPTDFSKNSWNAIVYALQFYANETCNFYLLHVTSISDYNGGTTGMLPTIDTIDTALVKETKTKLLRFLKKIKSISTSPLHSFSVLTSNDYFIDAIRKHIYEKNIDIIIMGTKGASGLKEAVIGTNTGDLITKVKCPVLVVPENAKFKFPKEIAFPTDYNLFYQNKILSSITELSKMFDSSIRILHITKKDEHLTQFQQENKEYLNDFFMDEKHSFHRITNSKIDAGIQCFVESRDINLIIMIAKNLNLFQQILFKPRIEEISYHTNVPFLVLHE